MQAVYDFIRVFNMDHPVIMIVFFHFGFEYLIDQIE